MTESDFDVQSVVRHGRRLTVYVFDAYRQTTYQYQYKVNARREVIADGGGSFKDRSRWETGRTTADAALKDRRFDVVSEDEWITAPWVVEGDVARPSESLADYLDQLDDEQLERVEAYVTDSLEQTDGDGE